jgi:hypothetical protein
MKVLSRLWSDEAGFVISSELVLVATILVIGMVVGLTTIRDQVVQELADVAGAISDVNQSYHYGDLRGHHSWSAGSDFKDKQDFCDGPGQRRAGQGTNCVRITCRSSEEGGRRKHGGGGGHGGGHN